MLYTIKNKKEIRKASHVLAKAFRNDPLFTSFIKDESQKEPIVRLWTSMFLRYTFKYGKIMATSENFEGVMAFLPGKFSKMSLLRIILSGSLFPMIKMGRKLPPEFAMAFKPLDATRDKHMKGDYLYLQIIGVNPKFQGKGYGRLLLNELINVSAEKEIPIYLETESLKNVGIYKHFGFNLIDEISLPKINHPMWILRRDVP